MSDYGVNGGRRQKNEHKER